MSDTPDQIRAMARQCFRYAEYHHGAARTSLLAMALHLSQQAEVLERQLRLPSAKLGQPRDLAAFLNRPTNSPDPVHAGKVRDVVQN